MPGASEVVTGTGGSCLGPPLSLHILQLPGPSFSTKQLGPKGRSKSCQAASGQCSEVQVNLHSLLLLKANPKAWPGIAGRGVNPTS